MSIRTVSASPTTSNAGLNTKALQSADTWRRNPQWLALPTVLPTDQKMVGLHAIFPSANFIALVASGDYTVDWGDGVIENFASDVVAYHEYDYANVAFDGTLTDLGYKQAIVIVTPQAGQNLTYLNLNQKHNQTNLQAYTSGFLDIAVSSAELTDLRVVVSTPSSTAGVINFNLLKQFSLINSDCKQLNNFFNGARSLQSIGEFVTSTDAPVTAAVTFTDVGDLINLTAHGFKNGDSVLFTTITSTTGITVNINYYIINTTADTFQVSSTYGGSVVNLVTNGTGTVVYGTNMNVMFSNCLSLTTIPLFNTSNVTIMTNMFNNCSSLTTVPLFNTVNVINISNMFQSCSTLSTVPLFNTSNVTIMSSMFASCSALSTVPLFNTVNVTTMASMFNGCTTLSTVPLFNTVNVTTMASMFNGCTTLSTVPLFNTANVTIMTSMFPNCLSLTTVPLFNTANVTTMTTMFLTCSALATVPALVTTAVTTSSGFNNMFANCRSLIKIEAKDFRFTFSVTNCKLSAASLDEIYTNLPIAVGQTITVSGNYGTATDNPTIATAKGWTVSG